MENIIDYKAILEKKNPTGQEIGQLLFASALHEKNWNKELYTQKEFTKAENRLSQQERVNYEPYRLLYNIILDTYNNLITSGFNTFTSSFYAILFRIRQFEESSSRQVAIYTTPLIVTESEYKQIYQQTVERLHKEGIDTQPTKNDIALTIRGQEENITPESYYKHFRAIAGIAVIKDPFNLIVTKDNTYIDKSKDKALFNLIDDLKQDKDIIDSLYKDMKEYVAFLYSFRKFIEIVEKFYQIPNLLDSIGAKTKIVCERTIEILHEEISHANSWANMEVFSTEERKARLEAIKEIFPRVDMKTLQPKAKQIKVVFNVIEETYNNPANAEIYKSIDPFMRVLKPEVL